ncbi:MAG: hypothetical protein WBE40_04580 [Thermoplasmata archaeon]
MFSGYGDVTGGFGLYFERCGQFGVTGLQPSLIVGENWNGSVGLVMNGTTNCAFLNQPYFAGYGYYDLLFASVNSSALTGTYQLTVPFQVAMVEHNNSAPTVYDGWGLANWMTSWNLTSTSGTPLPLAQPSCRSWVPSVVDCVANTSGWFAVVLSASGEWINSYGSIPGGGIGWSEPITALVSHQQLVVVVPSGWNVSGDQVSPASTIATSTVTGGFIL